MYRSRSAPELFDMDKIKRVRVNEFKRMEPHVPAIPPTFDIWDSWVMVYCAAVAFAVTVNSFLYVSKRMMCD